MLPRKQLTYLLSLNISAAARNRLGDEMEHEQREMRRESAKRITDRLDDIALAVDEAVEDPTCKALTEFLNGRGDLVIGRQKDVNDLLIDRGAPLASQSADEVRFVEATANFFGARK